MADPRTGRRCLTGNLYELKQKSKRRVARGKPWLPMSLMRSNAF